MSVTRSLHFVRYQPTSPGPRGQSPRPTHSKPCHVRQRQPQLVWPLGIPNSSTQSTRSDPSLLHSKLTSLIKAFYSHLSIPVQLDFNYIILLLRFLPLDSLPLMAATISTLGAVNRATVLCFSRPLYLLSILFFSLLSSNTPMFFLMFKFYSFSLSMVNLQFYFIDKQWN